MRLLGVELFCRSSGTFHAFHFFSKLFFLIFSSTFVRTSAADFGLRKRGRAANVKKTCTGQRRSSRVPDGPGFTAKKYSPTARFAGTTTEYSSGSSESDLGDYAWYQQNSGKKTHPVGEKKPNPWGLYDMHGNVFEWCQDWYGDYPSGPVTDPTGPSSGSYRVLRGGCWGDDSEGCRSANRGRSAPDSGDFLGFRVLRSSIK